MKICILGGAGFVGSALVPVLQDHGHDVMVFDQFWFGWNLPDGHMSVKRGDMRSYEDCFEAFKGQDAIIHLACISNDPSFELDPLFGASVNGPDTMQTVIRAAREAGVSRFVYASSSSVYGVHSIDDTVNEFAELRPLTDYSRFKIACELVLKESGLDWTILRPATVCGWSPRLRLDVIVNALTAAALRTRQITVYGPALMRPNIHIQDMVAAYLTVLADPRSFGRTYNIGAENLSLGQIGDIVAEITRADLTYERARDERSYRIDSSFIAEALGFKPVRTIHMAVKGILANLWHGQHTVNITRMQGLLRKGNI